MSCLCSTRNGRRRIDGDRKRLRVRLEDAIDRPLPREDIYRHRHGSRGHGRDHVLPAFVSPSLTLPVLSGRPALGTWQSVVLVDTNADNPDRNVRLSFLRA